MQDEDIFEIEELDSWEELKATLLDLKPGYIFRGQTEANWNIQTTIERKSGKYKSLAERHMFREFEKNIYNYDLKRVPESKLEILLFLQHFGAPTRLIDFTESFYVASFFALNNEYDDRSSIYAINATSLYSRLISFADDEYIDLLDESLGEDDYPIPNLSNPKVFIDMVLSHSKKLKFVATVHPIYHHERSNPQFSIHITIGNINESFLKNFDYFLKNSSSKQDSEKPFIKFTFPNDIRSEALYDLNHMNINYSNLFPDFGGYIKNLYLDYECGEYERKKFFNKTFEQT
jgi:hypothetical protein